MSLNTLIQASDLTLVIPLDFKRRGIDLLKRVMLFKKKLAQHKFNVIFGVNSSPNMHFQFFKKIIQNTEHFSYASEACKYSHLSRLRNIALAQVTTSHVLFLDIDIFPDVEMLQKVVADLNDSQNQLVMYPCLYLSKKGNSVLFKQSVKVLTEAFYDYRRDLVKHLAFPSSIIACDLTSIQAIQGYDEAFIGYAYEDLDFMIRLFHQKQLIQYTPELMIDKPYLAPMMSTGFRAILAEVFLDKLLERKYFMHLFHKKDQNQDYYQFKKINREIFQNKLKEKMIKKNESIPPNYRLIPYIEKFKKQNKDYSVLWAEIKGYQFRK